MQFCGGLISQKRGVTVAKAGGYCRITFSRALIFKGGSPLHFLKKINKNNTAPPRTLQAGGYDKISVENTAVNIASKAFVLLVEYCIQFKGKP